MSQPLAYIERIRSYYQTLGYGAPYRWYQFEDVAFHKPTRPVAQSTVAIITTASLFNPTKGDQGPGAPYNGAAKFFEISSLPTEPAPDLRISHIAIDRAHTTAEDPASYFPLEAMKRLAAMGEIGRLAPRIHGLPTNRSHRTTLQVDCPELVARCQEDGVDIALLVPNCPVCHQSVVMAANALEAAGISSVISGCAKDIVEHVGAPRFLFNDFPLGNGAGRPNDPQSQLEIARQALAMVDTASGPRTTEKSPFCWPDDPAWKIDYSNASLLTTEEINEKRRAFEQAKKDAPKKP
ncbi:MAG: glycine reductase [Rhizobiaceae bacterium]|nr:glycine reductase [Rhizobiaceae bacterium]